MKNTTADLIAATAQRVVAEVTAKPGHFYATPKEARQAVNEAKALERKAEKSIEKDAGKKAQHRHKTVSMDAVATDVAGEPTKKKNVQPQKYMLWVAPPEFDVEQILTPQMRIVARVAKKLGRFTITELCDGLVKESDFDTVQSPKRIYAWYRGRMIENKWIAAE